MQIFNWKELQNSDFYSLFSKKMHPDFSGTDISAQTGISIGCFDGVHLGHQQLIKKLIENCKQNHLYSGVITFSKPLGNLYGRNYEGDICSLEERLKLLEKENLDFVLVIDIEDFENTVHSWSGKEFLDFVNKFLNFKYITEGTNFRCGYKGQTGINEIADYCKENHICYDFVEPVILEKGGIKISSTEIRKALASGDNETAEKMLGRSFQRNSSSGIGEKILPLIKSVI